MVIAIAISLTSDVETNPLKTPEVNFRAVTQIKPS